MIAIALYKTTEKSVLDAVAERERRIHALNKKGRAFAKKFGGQLLYHEGAGMYSLSGLTFPHPKDCRFWTEPERLCANRQKPRRSIKEGTAQEKKELVELIMKWEKHFPHEIIKLDPILDALGISWWSVCSGGGFDFFTHADTMYFTAGATVKLNSLIKKISTSEYVAAQDAFAMSVKKVP